MLSGRRAFSGDTSPEGLAAILRDQPRSLAECDSQVPAHVSAVVQRCLEKNPEQRFQSARDLAFSLRHLLSTPDTRARDVGANQLPERHILVPARRILALAAVCLAIITGVVWFNERQGAAAGATRIQSLAVLPLSTTRPVLPAAYDAYVRGRHAWDKRGEADLQEAIRFFQESIDADPTYAPAYAGLADSYGQLGYGSYVSPEDSFPRARAAALRALELDPGLPEAHAALGYTSMYYEWDFAKAEAEYKRAIELNPNYAIAHQWYAYLMTALERPASAPEREIAIARKLDPLSVPINIDQAYILHYYQRNDEALRAAQLALEMNPKYPPGYFWLGRIYTSEHRYKEAESALRNIGPFRTWTPAMAALGYLYAKTERADDAKAVLAEFDALARTGRYASAYAIAVIYAGLGDRERALSALEAAYRERSHWLVWLKRDPRWNEIREQPRFRELVRRVGLPS
jgi:tetratricopeptide (TPR) repeat protein